MFFLFCVAPGVVVVVLQLCFGAGFSGLGTVLLLGAPFLVVHVIILNDMQSAYGYGLNPRIKIRQGMPEDIWQKVLVHCVMTAYFVSIGPTNPLESIWSSTVFSSFVTLIFGWYKYYAKETYYESEDKMRSDLTNAGHHYTYVDWYIENARAKGRLPPKSDAEK